MLPEQTTVSELRAYRTSLSAEGERLKEALERVQLDITAIDRMLTYYPAWRAEHPAAEIAKKPQATADDIRHCSSQNEALVEIGKLNNGFVRSREAGRLFQEAGLTTSRSINAANATAYRRLTEHSDFDYHEPGTFKYLPFFTDEQTSVRPTNPTIATNGHTLNGF